MYAYVGSRTTRERNARGEGISVYRVDPAVGALERVQVLGDLVNPSYLALSRDGQRLYCVHGDGTEASSFDVDATTGQLRLLNRQGTQGRNPVHLALADDGRHLVVTNHLGSSLAVLPIADDGSLRPASQLVQISGPVGPHRVEQQQAKPHFNPFDPSGRWIVVPDKGLDRVFSYRFEGGSLVPAVEPFVQAREGAGPRSAVFHPSMALAYVVNELDSTLTTYAFDASVGSLRPLHLIPTLPPTHTGNSRAAGIAIDVSGQTLYISNRGHDSVAVFRLNAGNGLPSFVDAVPTMGRTPRFFTLSPDGRHLYALNEDSDSIVVFDVGADSTLSRPRTVAHCGSPVCLVFSPSEH